jgi:hypothetical protein
LSTTNGLLLRKNGLLLGTNPIFFIQYNHASSHQLRGTTTKQVPLTPETLNAPQGLLKISLGLF